MGVGMVLGGAPTWVYALLAVLIVLGVRRFRTREVAVAVALIPSVAFLLWSLVGAHGLARMIGDVPAALTWFGGAAAGWLSMSLLAEPRGVRLPGGRVRLPGTRLPLVLYLVVFAARFACGAWAAIRPDQAGLATGVGIAVGAAMTARLVAAVVRWVPPTEARPVAS